VKWTGRTKGGARVR